MRHIAQAASYAAEIRFLPGVDIRDCRLSKLQKTLARARRYAPPVPDFDTNEKANRWAAEILVGPWLREHLPRLPLARAGHPLVLIQRVRPRDLSCQYCGAARWRRCLDGRPGKQGRDELPWKMAHRSRSVPGVRMRKKPSVMLPDLVLFDEDIPHDQLTILQVLARYLTRREYPHATRFGRTYRAVLLALVEEFIGRRHADAIAMEFGIQQLPV